MISSLGVKPIKLPGIFYSQQCDCQYHFPALIALGFKSLRHKPHNFIEHFCLQMHSSTKLQSPPLSVFYFCLCDKVYH